MDYSIYCELCLKIASVPVTPDQFKKSVFRTVVVSNQIGEAVLSGYYILVPGNLRNVMRDLNVGDTFNFQDGDLTTYTVVDASSLFLMCRINGTFPKQWRSIPMADRQVKIKK